MFREQGQLQTLPPNDFDLKYSLCQQLLNITKNRQSSLDEIHFLYEQNQILNNIKNQIEVKKANKLLKPVEDTEQVDNLSISTIIYKPERPSFKRPPINRSSRNFNKSYNQSFQASRTKVNIDIESALTQIQQKCSQNTTSQIRQLIKKVNEMNTKLTEFQRVNAELQKARKDIQTYKIRENQFERKLQSQKKMKSSLSSKQNQRILEKQKYISKCQTALVLNQKRIAQSLKRLTTKQGLIHKQQSDLLQQRKLVDDIWDNIVNKLESPTDTFKTDIYIKLKESLKRQRNIMIEESQELDKLHQTMNKMIAQIQQV